MLRRIASCSGVACLLVGLALVPGTGKAGVFDQIWGEPGPPTLTDVARLIDHIQGAILNQGTVVVKQPDIWSQARMTKFRKEFEDTMSPELVTFVDKLAAQIARSDAASLQSETSLAAVLNPFAKGQNPTVISSSSELAAAVKNVPGAKVDPNTGQIIDLPTLPAAFGSNAPIASTFALLNQAVTGTTKDAPGAIPGITLGLEPNIHLDEKADYINHLHRIRRVNLGDDNSDSAGYGLYLMRVPISIQPGDKTKKGFGAIVNMTMRHDFGPNFLALTYRNLVINDLIDMLGPNVYELIRSGQAARYHNAVVAYLEAKKKAMSISPERGSEAVQSMSSPDVEYAQIDAAPLLPQAKRELNSMLDDLVKLQKDLKAATVYQPTSRSGGRVYAIAPSDVRRVFVEQNLLNLAYAAQQALDLANSTAPATNRVRATDVRTYLRHELESAYDVMQGRCREQPALLADVAYIEDLTDQVNCRKFEGPKGVSPDSEEERNEFYTLYESFTHRLPGNLRYRPIGVLAWGVALEAGLLNRQLQDDMKSTKGAEGYACPPEVSGMTFYLPEPPPEFVAAFEEYIKARWPMITFALEPVTDQQNIQDAFTRRRDLQLAVAFALSAGRISFRQAIQFTRQLQYEAQTIALNQTVAAFAHGNDTFGWRFSPRYQTPPEESNFQAVTNLLTRGGPGPNYGLANSKIEPGMRELTAVVVMPSFVRGMRLDVAGDWFRLTDPDERKLHTARSIELGRRINEARAALDAACQCGLYRPEDTERLRVRLHQLEVMLPLQTQFVKVPYENTLGGFALFTQGTTALLPELSGYEGIEYLDPTRPTDIIVYGKHFSIYENAVVVGGRALLREGTAATTVPNPSLTAGNPVFVSNTLTPFRDADGNLAVLSTDGKSFFTIKDAGSYDILSREVMRVRIPAGVNTSTREDLTEVVELYISTPNGISNRLQIPVRPRVPAAVSSRAAFTLLSTSLALRVTATLVGSTATATKLDVAEGTRLLIQPTGWRLPLPPSIDLNVKVSLGSTPPSASDFLTISGIPLNTDGDTYVAEKPQLDAFADRIFKLFGKLPLTGEWPAAALAVNPTGFSDVYSVTNSLKLTFNYMVPTASSTPAGGASAPVASAGPRARPMAVVKPGGVRDPMMRPTSATLAKPEDLAAALAMPSSDEPPVPASVPPPPTLSPPSGAVAEAPGAADPPTADAPAGPTANPTAPGPASRNADRPQVPAPTTVPSPTVLVAPQHPPAINVSVPVTNVMPANRHAGWFHRQSPTPNAPAATRPVRGPLLERLLGRP